MDDGMLLAAVVEAVAAYLLAAAAVKVRSMDRCRPTWLFDMQQRWMHNDEENCLYEDDVAVVVEAAVEQ